MADRKLISIIMPFRNEEEFLQECMTSILNQSEQNWELWAVDDYSDDRGPSLIDSISKDDPRVQLIQSNGNGIPAALQTGYEKCSGEIITRMDADDIMPIDKLKNLKSQLKKNCVSTGLVEYFSAVELGDGYLKYQQKMNEVLLDSSHDVHAFQECFLPSPAWMMYREDFERIGGFKNPMLPEDYDLYFRILLSEIPIQAHPSVVHLWRDSPNRTSRTDPIYQPLEFVSIKIHYFLEWIWQHQRPLVLWGAGKRGKKMATELNKKGIRFQWVTDNPKKLKVPIYGKTLQNRATLDGLSNPQIILSIASPKEKEEVRSFLCNELKLVEGNHFWWFC